MADFKQLVFNIGHSEQRVPHLNSVPPEAINRESLLDSGERDLLVRAAIIY